MGRPRSVIRFQKRKYEPKPRPPASPLKCPKCGALAKQEVGARSSLRVEGMLVTLFFTGLSPVERNAVRVLCSAGCPPFAVTLPRRIRKEPLE